MTFNSIPYLVYLAVVVLIYWLLPTRFRAALIFSASLLFYASWGVLFVWLPLLIAVVVYLTGRKITAVSPPSKNWMWMGVGFMLIVLVFFKYRGALLAGLAFLGISLGARSNPLATSIVFPMGISFYTFEAIAYLIDLRQGRVKMPTFLNLCLFFFFWPNILSGPIVRARELMPQLSFRQAFEPRFCFEGMDRLIWGLVQKNVFANVLGTWVDKGFAPTALGAPSTLDAWFLAVAFGAQIYFDFAGYTNMALGAARLIGIKLPENFRFPYHAATPPDFWSRWHMTLSRWVRDYLFFPINAKWSGAPFPLYVSLVAVMALVGLWHGAGWGFVVWGILHGIYLMLYRIYERLNPAPPSSGKSRLSPVFWRALTLVAVITAWVPFRAPNLQKAGTLLSSMFLRATTSRAYSPTFYLFTGFVVLFCVFEPLILTKLIETEERAGADGPSFFRIIVRPLAYTVGLLLFLLFDQNGAQFIYSQF
jgi:D-alanyl-lipoteichoic acid acyltransferase DltB (MBOAT superfamily)